LLLQGHGVMDVSISDPQRFARQYAIGKPVVWLGDIKERLLTVVLGELQDVIATHAPGDLTGLNRMISEVEATVMAQIRDKFDAVGLMLKAFEMKPLTAARTTAEDLRNMGLLDVATYQQLQAADALRDAAKAPGGAAGTGVGLGAGIGLGQALAGAFAQPQQQPVQQQAAPATPTTRGEIEAAIENLDIRLANGEISEETYKTLLAKFQAKLDAMK
jgi:membrane protease subunit (stomatin/prohibitin family)